MVKGFLGCMSKTAPAILVPESDRGGRGAKVERGRNAMERDETWSHG